MNDEYLLKKFLDRCYTVSLVNHEREAGEISLVSLGNNEFVNRTTLENELSRIFGKEPHITQFFNDWYRQHLNNVLRDFTAFLNECDLVLGLSNWELKHNVHGRINMDKLSQYYYGTEKPHHNTLKSIYDAWYDNKIIDASEKIMRNW
jgi:hypothetical protein